MLIARVRSIHFHNGARPRRFTSRQFKELGLGGKTDGINYMAMDIEPGFELSLLHLVPWRIMKTSEELSLPRSCLSEAIVLKDSPLIILTVNYKERSQNAETSSHALII